MSAYLVAFVDTSDTVRYDQEYVPPVVEQIYRAGGKLLCAADLVQPKEGVWPKGRTVIIEFPDLATAESWYHSAEYQPYLALRGDFATSALAFVPGLA